MPSYEIIPWPNAKALMEKVQREGFPPEIVVLNDEIERATINAERLCVLFGLMPCQVAINEIVALKLKKDAVWGRLAMEMEV